MTGELGQITDSELWHFYKNTCHTREVSFAEFKSNYFNPVRAAEPITREVAAHDNTIGRTGVCNSPDRGHFMNTLPADEEQSRPSAEVPRPPALRAPEPQDAFSWATRVETAEEPF